MSWRYVLGVSYLEGETDEADWNVHEYYTDPEGWSGPVGPSGSSLEDLRADFARISEAFERNEYLELRTDPPGLLKLRSEESGLRGTASSPCTCCGRTVLAHLPLKEQILCWDCRQERG